jgi:hypothetical protein
MYLQGTLCPVHRRKAVLLLKKIIEKWLECQVFHDRPGLFSGLLAAESLRIFGRCEGSHPLTGLDADVGAQGEQATARRLLNDLLQQRAGVFRGLPPWMLDECVPSRVLRQTNLRKRQYEARSGRGSYPQCRAPASPGATARLLFLELVTGLASAASTSARVGVAMA